MSTGNIKLSFACALYDRMQPLYTGEVKPEGIDLEFLRIEAPRIIFDNMAGSQAYDLSEMSSSEFIARCCAGDDTFVALPVFPSRAFRHSFIAIHKDSGIRRPKDLAGKRIGVPLYTMTAAIWIRGFFGERPRGGSERCPLDARFHQCRHGSRHTHGHAHAQGAEHSH
jgi:4,5-dihydroxyphthalate decarboxylase